MKLTHGLRDLSPKSKQANENKDEQNRDNKASLDANQIKTKQPSLRQTSFKILLKLLQF
jgi:hypothetical protein